MSRGCDLWVYTGAFVSFGLVLNCELLQGIEDRHSKKFFDIVIHVVLNAWTIY